MELADAAPEPPEAAERTALRTLVWDAAAGLADRDRAMLDLHLRQGLDGAELGEAMGMSADQSYVQLNRLRAQVERSLGALLVARTNQSRCEDLDRLLTGWDGTLTPLIRKRVARHVEQCDICSERKRGAREPVGAAGFGTADTRSGRPEGSRAGAGVADRRRIRIRDSPRRWLPPRPLRRDLESWRPSSPGAPRCF